MKDDNGFTLLELLIVVALLGIVSAIAVPNFLTILPNIRLKSAAQELYANFQKAKLTAVKRNKNTAVTFSSTGYTVFIDDDADFVYDSGTEEVVLTVLWSEYKGVSVGTVSFDNSTGQPCIAFRPDGLPADADGGLAEGEVPFSNSTGKSLEVGVRPAGAIKVD